MIRCRSQTQTAAGSKPERDHFASHVDGTHGSFHLAGILRTAVKILSKVSDRFDPIRPNGNPHIERHG